MDEMSRKARIVELLKQGSTYMEIAKQLGVSISYVYIVAKDSGFCGPVRGKTIKLLNGLPLGAMPQGAKIVVKEISKFDTSRLLSLNKIESYVGHETTAKILSSLLEVDVPFNRATAIFEKGDLIVVAAYVGPRLEEGATKLPDGAKFRYFLVKLK